MHDRLLTLQRKFQELKSGEEGQDAYEYALLCSFIVLVMVASLSPIATILSTYFTNISNALV